MGQEAVDLDPVASVPAHLESAIGSKVGGGRYSLVRILGRGAMGVVWLARDERLDCDVALKFLPPQIRYDLSALDELRRETARSHRLTHPNIVRVHDLYELPGENAFISMEYVNGRNLGDLRVEQPSGVLSWQFLKPMAEQLCAALEYAHSEKIVHRDLKPSNLLLEERGRLKLADFGVARAVSDTMMRISSRQADGTLLYMSPQQIEGETPQPADDLYAFGAVFYELLTGKPPFYTGDIAYQVRNVSPRPMHERMEEAGITNDVPHDIEQAIMSCLAKNASGRPRAAVELAQFLRGEKLKLVNMVETRTRSNAPENPTLTTRRPRDIRKPWRWAIGSGITCGVLVWALAHLAQANARKRGASEEASPSSQPGVPAVKLVGSNDSATVQPPAPVPSLAATNANQAATAPPPPQSILATLAATHGVTASAKEDGQPPTASKAQSQAAVETKPAGTPDTAAITAPNTERPTTAPAGQGGKATALQLLQKGNVHVSARSKDRVLEIVSNRSSVDDVPRSWRILYHDEKATYNAVEVRFEGGEMERVREPNRFFDLFTSGSAKILDLAKVKIDSDEAVRIAVSECNTDEIKAKSVELKLERGYGGLPVWNVKLFGLAPGKSSEETSLGSIILLAEDGKVLKKEIVTKIERPVSKR